VEAGGYEDAPNGIRTRTASQTLTPFSIATDVAELGHSRRALDAIFRECPTVHLPGYSRPVIYVRDYQALMGPSGSPEAERSLARTRAHA
jgi:hypothetical protein